MRAYSTNEGKLHTNSSSARFNVYQHSFSALHYAADYGHTAVVKELLACERVALHLPTTVCASLKVVIVTFAAKTAYRTL